MRWGDILHPFRKRRDDALSDDAHALGLTEFFRIPAEGFSSPLGGSLGRGSAYSSTSLPAFIARSPTTSRTMVSQPSGACPLLSIPQPILPGGNEIMRSDCAVARNIMDRQDRVLRAAESRGMTLHDIAIETGIPLPTLQSYRRTDNREPSVMSLAAFVKLAKALPTDLASLLILDSGYDLSPKRGREKDWMALGERMSRLAAKIFQYQATGPGIDHQEDADLTQEARALAPEMQEMVVEQ